MRLFEKKKNGEELFERFEKYKQIYLQSMQELDKEFNTNFPNNLGL